MQYSLAIKKHKTLSSVSKVNRTRRLHIKQISQAQQHKSIHSLSCVEHHSPPPKAILG